MAENVTKPKRMRELGPVDISGFKAIVARTSEHVWNTENEQKENDFDCFHHTRHIVFRFIEGFRDHRCFYSTQIWSVWQDQLMPIMKKVVEPYGFERPEFPKVMLARLQAGQVIDPHKDGAGSNLYTHKIHVPIQTNEKARMFINDRSFHLEEGKAYEVNNLVPHAVENLGAEDRIHLIFEVFDNVESKA
ncbi:MAG: aspartyl beta-hydroxylase [Pyrinomonadaceae bacterium]|nr:aspartyl beta-hydroxylase [Pyrinomonadaceae bacterium]